MLDLKHIRENPELVKKGLIAKRTDINIDDLLLWEEQKRKLQYDFDQLRSYQNKMSKDIPRLRKSGENIEALLKEMQEAAAKLKDYTAEITLLNDKIEKLMTAIPNIPHESVPAGKTEEDNIIIRQWQPIESSHAQTSQSLLEHQDLAQNLGILDFPRGAKITGSGFPVYQGQGALLERALINFMLEFHTTRHNYRELSVPHIVNRKAMFGTGQLPKLEEDMYRIEEEDFFLIPTGEVPVTNLFADEILPCQQLPLKYVAYTPCFRREAGSYGRDTKGLQRIHQFNKVEMVRFVKPESSYEVLEEMVEEAEAILKALELPYRVALLNTSDLSFASAKTYDIEVWAPGVKKYLEVSSLSNFEDFQARRASIRYRDENGKVRFLHTLNGSGLATPRTYIAVLENYQNEDGSITIPQVLRKYMNGAETISADR
jgi:seryl-tRNA synthetase